MKNRKNNNINNINDEYDILSSDLHNKADDFWRMLRIMSEFSRGFRLFSDFKPGVTIFGSARNSKGDKYYEHAYECGQLLGKAGIAVVTGGGPGIMEAGNRGAFEAGGESVGLNIKLPHEQHENGYTTKSYTMHYFFVRKVMLVKCASAFIIYPGGFGTMDEFFEVLTLMQTHKLDKAPIVLVGNAFWKGLIDWFKDQLSTNSYISDDDYDYLTILDTPQEVADHIINWFNTHPCDEKEAQQAGMTEK